ncbi:MAG: alpha-1,2-fucosyltransferase [Candidatus Wallbacteria bacterium]|nr:alpha-1,2-fucosyltransferase [Candidatus Wallbacteria bacterium]
MNKVIAIIQGGLGNQLFGYAAARRLALVNKAELVIDDLTGFVREKQFGRKYSLDKFSISARKATAAERLEPCGRLRRALMIRLSRLKPFELRRYLEQEQNDFDQRLLDFKVNDTVYLDGYWQSEGYFKDVEQFIRKDLMIKKPEDKTNRDAAEQIRGCNAVAVHVRWFDAPGCISSLNLSAGYYQRAIGLMDQKLADPRYFLFSDDPEPALAKLTLPRDRTTIVSHNLGDENASADLWLMSQCKHFIIANSTFSWWGAWLSGHDSKIIIAPDLRLTGITSWGFPGLIPEYFTLV